MEENSVQVAGLISVIRPSWIDTGMLARSFEAEDNWIGGGDVGRNWKMLSRRVQWFDWIRRQRWRSSNASHAISFGGWSAPYALRRHGVRSPEANATDDWRALFRHTFTRTLNRNERVPAGRCSLVAWRSALMHGVWRKGGWGGAMNRGRLPRAPSPTWHCDT